MPKDTFWFKHDHNARTDKEMVRVRMKMGMNGIGLFWCIVEMLYEEDGYLLRNEYERIAFELQSNIDDVTRLVEEFNLFKKDEEKFWSDAVNSRIQYRKNKSEKARESVSYRKDRTNVERSNNEQVTIRRDKIREEDKESTKEKKNTEPTLKELEDMVVIEMMNVWKAKTVGYYVQKEDDYTACLSMAYKIADIKGWSHNEALSVKRPEIIKSWSKILDFVKSDKFYKNLQIKRLDSEWQGICLKMNNLKESKETKKEANVISLVTETDLAKYRKPNV